MRTTNGTQGTESTITNPLRSAPDHHNDYHRLSQGTQKHIYRFSIHQNQKML